MKNTIKFLGIIAIVAIIGFSMAGCATEEEEEPSLDGTWVGSGSVTNAVGTQVPYGTLIIDGESWTSPDETNTTAKSIANVITLYQGMDSVTLKIGGGKVTGKAEGENEKVILKYKVDGNKLTIINVVGNSNDTWFEGIKQ
jgi:hypothetical protein